MTIESQIDQRINYLDELFGACPVSARKTMLAYAHCIEETAENLTAKFKTIQGSQAQSKFEIERFKFETERFKCECMLVAKIMEDQIENLYQCLVDIGVDRRKAEILYLIGEPIRSMKLT